MSINAVDWINTGSVYPTSGYTLADNADVTTPSAQSMGSPSSPMPAAAVNMLGASPVKGLVIFGVLVVVLMVIVHVTAGRREDADFSNVKASVYNVLLISLVAAVGLPLIKQGFVTLANVGLPGAADVAAYTAAA